MVWGGGDLAWEGLVWVGVGLAWAAQARVAEGWAWAAQEKVGAASCKGVVRGRCWVCNAAVGYQPARGSRSSRSMK